MKVLPILLLGLLLAACTIPGPSMPAPLLSIDTGTPSPTAPTPSTSATASAVSESDTCLPDPGPLPSSLQGDPCPSAIAAVRAVVAPLGLPVREIYIEPGFFSCGDLWPGVSTPLPCAAAMPPIFPGTEMHGWVSFLGSAATVAVGLSRGVPQKLATSAPPPPWQATIAAFEVPPAGWVMP